jgi:hypothetical protein
VAAVAVPLALLGAAGFQAVQRTLLSARVRAIAITAPVCAAIAVSGTVLFDAVNPAILARSPLSIALGKPGLETLAPVVLEEILWKPHYTRLAAAVPSEPLRVATHADLPALLAARSTSLIVWSPGEEEDYAVSRTVCRAWPDAALYELRDAASLTRAFAASPQRVSAWPEEARDCDAEFETEVSRAERALARSARLADEGRLEEAAAVVEAQARRTFGDAKIFDATARALLAQDPTRGDVARAVEWASRGCEASGREEPLFCRTLADAHAARGNSSEALRAARVAKDAALSRGQEALAAQLELRIQGYARRATGR